MYPLMLLQLDGATDVLKAANDAGWTAGLLAFVVVCVLLFVGFWMKKDSDRVKEREDRTAKRIDLLEDKIATIQEAHAERLVQLTMKVTEAVIKSTDAQTEMQKSLVSMTETMHEMQESITDLCNLLRGSPCVALASSRGDYTITDKYGNVLDPQASSATTGRSAPQGRS
jgi:hypothetical protein